MTAWQPQPIAPAPGYGAQPRPARPPLRDLPAPARVADEQPLPHEILLESRRELAMRILRGSWRSAIVLVVLWELLVLTYVWGTGPTFLALSPLLLLQPDITLSMMVRALGFTPGGLGLAMVLVPIVGTALSLVMVPLAALWAGRVDPRRLLRERDVPREVASRVARCLLIPPAAIMVLLVLAVVCQAPLAWQDLSYGALAALAAGAGFLWCALLILRRVVDGRALTAPQPFAGEPQLPPVREQRSAQDRRHLPPHDEDPTAATFGRAVRATSAGILRWTGAAVLGSMWLVFGFADAAVVFSRSGGGDDLAAVARTGLAWPVYLVGGVLLVALTGLLAVAPSVAVRLARPLRSQVVDLRTVDSWSERARLNPWEARVCTTVAILDTAGAVLVVLALATVLGAFDELGVLGWTWIVLDLVLLAPLLYGGVLWAMRTRLRNVLYGPADLYMRRRTRWALVAPELGTRAQLAADPVVAARLRRLQEEAEGPATGPGLPARPAEGPLVPVAAAPPGELPDFGAGRDEEAPRDRPTRGRTIPRDVTDLEIERR